MGYRKKTFDGSYLQESKHNTGITGIKIWKRVRVIVYYNRQKYRFIPEFRGHFKGILWIFSFSHFSLQRSGFKNFYS